MQAHIWAKLICSQIVNDGFFFSGVEKTCIGTKSRQVSRVSAVIIVIGTRSNGYVDLWSLAFCPPSPHPILPFIVWITLGGAGWV